jgi:hypothetical protein
VRLPGSCTSSGRRVPSGAFATRMARRRALRGVVLVLTAVLPLACANGGTTATAGSTAPTSAGSVPDGTVPGGTRVVLACTDEILLTAVTRDVAGTTLNDTTCGAPTDGQAVATLVKEGADDQVAFLVARSGGWQLDGRGAVTAEADEVVPRGFSMSLYRSWRDKYDLRMNPQPTTTRGPSVSRPGTSAPAGNWCERTGDGFVCKDPRPTTTTTTLPKPTTTKAPTTTEPTTVPAPVTTVAKGPSAFCLSNPLDPRCSDPSFPG